MRLYCFVSRTIDTTWFYCFWKLPYYKNGYLLRLYNQDSELKDEKNIAYLGDYCGDDVCQTEETSDNCPADCLAIKPCNVNGLCDGQETPQNCPKDCKVVQRESKPAIALSFKQILIIFSLAIIAIGLVLGIRYRNRKDKDN